MGKDRPAASLAPGFRFHPTDDELVSYYLRRKICGKPFRFDAISEIDIYKAEPWDLPAFSKMKSRDLEWYFFSALDKKYENGSKTNRATMEGYWKTTGKDRPVYHKSEVAGMKKTLVFHRGRAPRGERTNWVMHEYRLIEKEVEKGGVAQLFVLCRIFLKSGPGPKNGEKYGAPYVEEDWEDDKEVDVGPEPFVVDATIISDRASFDMIGIYQNLEAEKPLQSSAPLSNDDTGCNYVSDPTALAENDTESLTVVNKTQFSVAMTEDQNFFSLPVQAEVEKVKNEYIPQPSHVMSHASTSYLPDEPIGDVNGYSLEMNDLSEPMDADSSEFDLHEQYLTYFDPDNIDQYISFDVCEGLLDNDLSLSDGPFFDQEHLVESTKQESTSDQQFTQLESSNSASSSKQVMATPKSEPDFEYPFFKQTSHMLGKFPGTGEFASELREKDMVARLHAASAQSSEPVRVSAGMIRIRDYYSADGDRMRWSLDKRGNLSIVLSFDLPGDESISDFLSGKMSSTLSRDWFYYIFFWVVVLAVSAKLGVFISAKMIV